MSEAKGFWNNATVVAVVTGVGVPVILGVAHYLGLTIPSAFAWLRAVGVFLGAEVPISRWAFWLWAIFTALAVLWIAVQIYFNANGLSETPKANSEPKSAAAYRTDIFFGFRWRWVVYAGGEVSNVTMYCPECDYEMSSKDFSHGPRYGDYLCRCEHCGYSHKVSGAAAPYEMQDRVEKAAERKIRTGEWRRVTG